MAGGKDDADAGIFFHGTIRAVNALRYHTYHFIVFHYKVNDFGIEMDVAAIV